MTTGVFVVGVLAAMAIGSLLFYYLASANAPPSMSSAVSSVRAAVIGQSEFRRLAERITEIRGGGAAMDGIHLLQMPVKISNDDYFLMGCDNSCAHRNFPTIPRHHIEEGRWLAGADDLQGSFGNSHGTQRKDGSWAVDAFYTSLPRQKYQASPEEVAWHYIRVKQLRAQNMPNKERIATMTAEATQKPWMEMR